MIGSNLQPLITGNTLTPLKNYILWIFYPHTYHFALKHNSCFGVGVKKNDKKTITYMYNNNCLLGRWFVITYSSVDVLDGKCN